METNLRRLRARIGGYTLHAKHDTRVVSQAGRDAFLASFERQVDPDKILDPVERDRRARAAKSAHFARLAYLSARTRAARKAA